MIGFLRNQGESSEKVTLSATRASQRVSGSACGAERPPRVIRDGIDRLMDLIKHESFTFVVNGEKFESTIAEAITLSPAIHESMKPNPLQAMFEFPRDSVKSSDFVHLLEFARSRDCISLSHDRVVSFVSISGQLRNDRLTLSLLSSLHSVPPSPNSSSAAPAVRTIKAFDLATVDECASQFSSYSIDELRLLDHQKPHGLLRSDCLALENENSLLHLLIDLSTCDNPHYHIRIGFIQSLDVESNF
jgi:hypothetical protein